MKFSTWCRFRNRTQLPTLRAVIHLNCGLAVEFNLQAHLAPPLQIHKEWKFDLLSRTWSAQLRPPFHSGHGDGGRLFPPASSLPFNSSVFTARQADKPPRAATFFSTISAALKRSGTSLRLYVGSQHERHTTKQSCRTGQKSPWHRESPFSQLELDLGCTSIVNPSLEEES